MPIYTKCGQCGKKILQGTKCECSKNRYNEYDKRVRRVGENKKYFEFYTSVEWKRLTLYIKTKYNGLCLMCLFKYKSIMPCDVVHHIEPIKNDYSKRLEEGNLIPLCHCCHNNIDHMNYTAEIKNELRKLLEQYIKKYI